MYFLYYISNYYLHFIYIWCRAIALGVSFICNLSDLQVTKAGNAMVKYADDIYMIFPASKTSTIPLEMAGVQAWATRSNRTLNVTKSSEIIMKGKNSRKLVTPSLTDGIAWVETLKILGIILEPHLSFRAHVTQTVCSASQSLYALRKLMNHGLQGSKMETVCRTTLVSRLLYASSSCWGPITNEKPNKLQTVSNRAYRWGLSGGTRFDIAAICQLHDQRLFQDILRNGKHVLHPSLPPVHITPYALRQHSHNRIIPRRTIFTPHNFIRRMLLSVMHAANS